MRQLLIILLSCVHVGALSEEPPDVETTLIAEVREPQLLASGKEVHRLVPATTIEQGQVVYYTVRIHNPTPVVARNVTVVRRVPANTVYVEGSASGPAADIHFSADGGQTFASPSQLTVVTPEGGTRRATPEDYTHIRWRLRYPLSAGSVALARFRAVFQ